MEKQCPKCSITKSITEFHQDSKRKDKLRYQCKLCQKVYDHQKHLKNYKPTMIHEKYQIINSKSENKYILRWTENNQRIKKAVRYGKKTTEEEAYNKILLMKKELENN